jgi:acetoin:2,6-dichlorophenolindophenol oxidoreductase subunit alpha
LIDIEKNKVLEIYKKMKLIREFEETALKLAQDGEISGSLHLYIGQEAVAVGTCSNLNQSDMITSTHRGHGHLIAKGGDVKYMFAELMGRKDGYNKGKGGSMHIAEPLLGILGANGIVGAGAPIGIGAALANKYFKNNKVVVTFFGDGALGTGAVHEAMNMAAVMNLPIIFICENNQYAVSLSVKNSCPLKKLSERAKSYSMDGITVDGMDAGKVYKAVKLSVEKARNGDGPSFVECLTYRYYDHSIGVEKLGLKYRTDEEIQYWKNRDPLMLWKNKIIKEKIGIQKEVTDIDDTVRNEIIEAVNFARESNFPSPESALEDMYSKNYEGLPVSGWIKIKN